MFLEILQNLQENTCARASFLTKLQAKVFSCEFCEISKNTFLTERLVATASVNISHISQENTFLILFLIKLQNGCFSSYQKWQPIYPFRP